MTVSVRDPKGYYACLDVAPTATSATIKAAFRNLAKSLHPDHNHGPRAQEEFQRLNEAYQVLSNDARRKAYDAKALAYQRAQHGARADGTRPGTKQADSPTGSASGAYAKAQARAAGTRQTHAHTHANARTAQNSANASSAPRSSSRAGAAAYAARRTRAADGPFEPPQSCQCCGKIAAQPRYVVFPTVRGFLFKTRRSTVEGVFCRTCADNTALRTAWKNWLLGWWSLPWGPFLTIQALLIIARGGYLPRDRNFYLLLRQARAFLMRNDQALAHGLALQANAYAANPQEKALAEGLLKAAPPVRGRVLKNRWVGSSWARLGQAVPPILATTLILIGLHQWTDVNLWGQRGEETVVETPALQAPSAIQNLLSEGLDRPMLLRTGRLYEVTSPVLPLRTGPGTGYRVLEDLEVGSSVLVTENAPEGGWVRVLTSDGQSGFVAGRYLTPGLNSRGLDGSFGTPDTTPDDAGNQPLIPPDTQGRGFKVPKPDTSDKPTSSSSSQSSTNGAAKDTPRSSPSVSPESSLSGSRQGKTQSARRPAETPGQSAPRKTNTTPPTSQEWTDAIPARAATGASSGSAQGTIPAVSSPAALTEAERTASAQSGRAASLYTRSDATDGTDTDAQDNDRPPPLQPGSLGIFATSPTTSD